MSRLHLVGAEPAGGRVGVQDLDGAPHTVSLLAYDGPPLHAGDWVVAHSGFALSLADADDVAAARAEWERVRAELPARGEEAT